MSIDERTFRTSRNLPHEPEAVFAAIKSPELLAIWWGPEGFTNTFEEFDFKESGEWRFVMHGPDGKSYPNLCRFEAIEPDRMIVVRHECLPYFTLTLVLVKSSGGTELTWEQVFDDSQTAQAVKQIVVPSNEQNIDRLNRLLSKARTV